MRGRTRVGLPRCRRLAGEGRRCQASRHGAGARCGLTAPPSPATS